MHGSIASSIVEISNLAIGLFFFRSNHAEIMGYYPYAINYYIYSAEDHHPDPKLILLYTLHACCLPPKKKLLLSLFHSVLQTTTQWQTNSEAKQIPMMIRR